MKTSCSAVWSNIHITPQGNQTPCCFWPSSLEFDREDTKKQMMQGKSIEGCSGCDNFSKHKQPNLRDRFNQYLPYSDNITSVDLSVDNICNFECVMCSSEYSHLAAKRESKFLGNTVAEAKYLHNTKYKQLLWETITRVKMFGGEPLVSSGFKQFVEWSKERINWSTIDLEIITNNSVSIPELYHEMLSTAKSLRVIISRDGLDGVNQMVRQGAEPLAKEIARFDAWKKYTTDVTIHSAVGIYNAMDQTSMRNWFAKHYPQWNCTMEMIQSPAYLDLRNMPKELKDIYAQAITEPQILTWLEIPGTDHFDAFVAVHRACEQLYSMDTRHNNPILHDHIEQYTGSVADFENIGARYA